jgi:hypothetical protein
MKKEYIDFVCSLHGYLIRVKEIHWNTNSNAEHLLCDEVEGNIHDCEDRFMECCMGMSGEHFPIGKLLPMLPNATDMIEMLKELEKDVLDLKKKLTGPENGGLFNILDDMQECCNKYKYRATQK